MDVQVSPGCPSDEGAGHSLGLYSNSSGRGCKGSLGPAKLILPASLLVPPQHLLPALLGSRAEFLIIMSCPPRSGTTHALQLRSPARVEVTDEQPCARPRAL